MARTGSIVWHILLPLVIFVPMAVTAFRLLMGHVLEAKLLKSEERCPTPWTGEHPYQVHYLKGYAPPVEQILCILVNFFHQLFQVEAAGIQPFVHDFLASFSVPVTITYLEASRTNRSLLLAFPAIWGIIYQNIGAGVTFPIYWATLIATTRKSALGTQIKQARAEAVFFGVVLGFIVPSVAMSYYGDIEPIAFWQAFPMWISVLQYLYLLFRPNRANSGAGHGTVQLIYVFLFIISTATHLRTISTYNFDLHVITGVYIPSLACPDAKKGDTALTSLLHFLQWDLVFTFSSALLASLWFAKSIIQGMLLVIWGMVSTVILGPGAATTGIYIWRESNLKQKRNKQIAAIKLAKAH